MSSPALEIAAGHSLAGRDEASSPALHSFARLTSAAAFLLIIAGGLVTSTRSGLAVPDWPLSFGQFFPPMIGGVFFEHGHRMIAGAVGILTMALAAWIHWAESRRWVRNLAKAVAAGILAQALLGGITVLYLLPKPVSIAHACLGQAVFCGIVLLAQVTSSWYLSEKSFGSGQLWHAAAAAAAAVYIQLFLGAVLRHTGSGLGLHLAWALVTAAVVLRTAYVVLTAGEADPAVSSPAALLGTLIPLQFALGLASWLAASGTRAGFWAAVFPTAHVALGALILGTCVVWTARAYKLR